MEAQEEYDYDRAAKETYELNMPYYKKQLAEMQEESETEFEHRILGLLQEEEAAEKSEKKKEA